MTNASASTIGRTLARLGGLKAHPSDGPTAGSTRDAVRMVIASAPAAVPIDHICEATGLHANTLRPHLDVLLALGAITREHAPSSGRGRRPWLYSAVETPWERDRRRLASALLEQLEPGDHALAAEAAQRWADRPETRAGPAESIDEAVANAAESMARIGFEVTLTPAGDRMDLQGCPYLDLIAERPVICEIHAALLQRLLEDSGQPVSLERLDVWSGPGVCTAHLRRADRVPHRTIRMTPDHTVRPEPSSPEPSSPAGPISQEAS